MTALFSDSLFKLRDLTQSVAADVIAPDAERVDAEAAWPERGLRALLAAGLGGLTVPEHHAGLGQGLVGLSAVTEVLGRACASTAMCFGMHCVAAAVIAAKATDEQAAKYLRPIVQGKHVTTLALSEPGTGAHFFLPESRLTRDGDAFVVNGQKTFVTNGGRADSYVISTLASDGVQQGEFNCLALDAGTPGMTWGERWLGFGMRGNESRGLKLDAVRVPAAQLLGEEGDQTWYVFEVVAPYFLTAIAGTYLGVAQAALETTIQHMKQRRFSHTGGSLAEVEVLQYRIGQLWTCVEKSRLLLQHAARLGDMGSPDALTAILASKADAANTAVATTNEAMTLCGGMAYRENSTLARLLRDARASHVMSPTTEMLTLWTGRSALGLSLF